MSKFALPSLLLLSPLFACGGPTTVSPSDAGAKTDVGSDAGPLSPLVVKCQTLARNFETKCAGSDTRPCLWSAYADLCVTGQTQLLVDSMTCLDGTTCRTFSDPNEGASCLATVHASGESAEAKSFLQAECTACNETCATSSGTSEIFPYLTDADLQSLSSCSKTLCSVVSGADAGGPACPSNGDFALFSACL